MRRAALALCLFASSCGGDSEPVVETIAFDGRPSAVVTAQGKVWVADDENHQVHVFHREGEPETDPIGVARNPIALAVGDGEVWVAHASGRLSSIDVRTREVSVEHTDPDASFTSVAVAGSRVFATDVDRGLWDGRRWLALEDGAVRVVASTDSLWVSGRDNTVARVDPDDGRERMHEVGFGPIGLAAVDGDVWVANSDDDSVQRVGERRFVPVGRAPVALVAADGRLYVANQDGRSISVVDPGRRSVERTIELDTQPRGIAAGLGAVWVVGTNRQALVRVVP